MNSGSVYSNRPERSRSRRSSSSRSERGPGNPPISTLSSATGSISPAYPSRSSRGSSRRRRGRHEETSRASRLLWFALGGAICLYLALLAAHELQQRRQRSQAAQTPSPPPAETAEDAEEAPPPPPPSTRPFRSDQIRDWTRATRMIEDAQKLHRDGRLTDASERLEAARILAPEAAGIRLALAAVRADQKHYEEAKLLLLDALARDPMAMAPRLQLAEVLSKLEQHDEALTAANWILETDTYSETGHRIAAHSLMNLGETARALTHLNRLVLLNRDNTEARNQLGFAHIAMGNHQKAIEVFQDILSADPANSQARYHIAVALAHLKDYPRLEEEIRTSSSRFGRSFVRAWLQSDDFDIIREEAEFIDLLALLGTEAVEERPPAEPEPEDS